MKKYIILIPIYNDRESLAKLIEDINSEIKSTPNQYEYQYYIIFYILFYL